MRLAFFAVNLAIFSLVAFPSTALTQDRSPELASLGYFVGEWSMDAEDQGSGKFACAWLGTSVLKCDTEFTFPSGAIRKTVGLSHTRSARPTIGRCTWARLAIPRPMCNLSEI